MEYHYDSFRDYYQGEGFSKTYIYLSGALFIILGGTGFLEPGGFLYPFSELLLIIVGTAHIAFPKFAMTWFRSRDYLLVQSGLLKWSFKKDKQELRLNEIKAVKQLVSGLQIYKEDGSSLFLPTHMIKSKVKFTEFNDLVLPHLEKNHE